VFPTNYSNYKVNYVTDCPVKEGKLHVDSYTVSMLHHDEYSDTPSLSSSEDQEKFGNVCSFFMVDFFLTFQVYWSEKYRTCLAIKDPLQRYTSLASLARDFIDVAQVYGRFVF
jgi:hypothetical protein